MSRQDVISRGNAARLLTEIMLLASRDRSDAKFPLSARIFNACALAGLTLPVKCEGEAHQNPHIDNCHQCAPHWEWIAPEIRIP